MLDLMAAAAAVTAPATGGAPLNWADLGLVPGIDLGFFTLRFYSLAYLAGLVFAYWHTRKMIDAPGAPLAKRHADDLFFYCMIGIIVGGRLGYVLFYKPEFIGTWEMFNTLGGGMSFHGGLIGCTLAMIYVSWRGGLNVIRVCDYVAVGVGMGMLLGRLANFINGELWGRPVESDVPWAMIFPAAGPEPRHPSQLYEAGLEGLLVLVVMLLLFWKTGARYRTGLLVGVFGVLIASGRFIVEFFREPDAHLSEFAMRTGLSMGQWLTIPLIVAGIGLILWSLSRPPLGSNYTPPAD
jgi:phosphatidylglycerol:prolipoprotein diacylglycerol transferase